MTWNWVQAIGYVGSVLMFLTFFMKTMIPLRLTAIAANCVMITYTSIAGIYPVLILQTCLLPLNVLRFIQMKRLITRVKAAARGDFKIEPLLPFMKHETRKDGDVLFKTGDRGDRMYFLQRGRVRLKEIDKVLKDGDVFGEIGLLSADKERTATAVCEGECDLYSVTQDVVLQLFYQKPEFSFFLVRLVTKRLLDNLEDAQFDAMATMGPAVAR
ncbi:MAG TPA: cyclic nucleotide-binding domain-containing protein [Kofleriaceae bacterium]|nr:cyclic nucleotide-binding domain-containing protein [Kofleriaceae bacterium]